MKKVEDNPFSEGTLRMMQYDRINWWDEKHFHHIFFNRRNDAFQNNSQRSSGIRSKMPFIILGIIIGLLGIAVTVLAVMLNNKSNQKDSVGTVHFQLFLIET